jgi:hypothetical protein
MLTEKKDEKVTQMPANRKISPILLIKKAFEAAFAVCILVYQKLIKR